MTETLDNFLTEVNNMYRVVRKLQTISGMMDTTSREVKTYHEGMKTLSERQASYIRALDGDTIQNATINFSPKTAEAEDRIVSLSISDPKQFQEFMRVQAQNWADEIHKRHLALIEIEELSDELTTTLLLYADRVKSLLK